MPLTPEQREQLRQENRARVRREAPELERFIDGLRAAMRAADPGSDRGLRITRLEIIAPGAKTSQPE